ncbi:hypothetical protein GOQ04_15805 [Emticicia sp. ODNR4P]|nr:hypothetical protein [Emticicia sp. ODNR4P]
MFFTQPFKIIIFFAFPFLALARPNSTLDSLHKKLNQLDKEGKSFPLDTVRINLLCQLSELEVVSSPKQSFSYLDTAERLAKKHNWQEGIMRINYERGFYYMSHAQYMVSTEFLFKSLYQAEQIKNRVFEAKNLSMLGLSFSELKDFKNAQINLQKALKIYQILGDKIRYTRTLHYIGLALVNEKNHRAALAYFQHAYQQNLKLQIHHMDMYCLSGIGSSQKELGKFDDALKTFEKLLILEGQYADVPDYDKMVSLSEIADIYRIKKKFNKAKPLFDHALSLDKKGGVDSYSRTLYERLYLFYKELGNNKAALLYFEKLSKIKDKIGKQDLEQQVKNLKFEYEYAKQEIQLNASKLEVSQEQQLRNISIIGLLVLLIGALWLWFNRLELSKKNKQIYTQSLEISKAYAQLEDFNKTLEQKVDQRTHELKQANIELQQKNEEILTALFEGQTLERKRVASELHNNLGSMLSAMRYRLQILDKEKLSSKEQKVYDSILEMMGTAYAEVRLISHNLLPAELEKKGLKGAIEKLIGDINLGQKLIIDLQMDDDILPKNKRFELELYSICLELINNIIKHAEATQASVSFYEENNLLIFTVSDNGKGMNLEKSNGFGLKNIEQRVQSNSGIMEIHTKEFEKTAIICKFPLEQIA